MQSGAAGSGGDGWGSPTLRKVFSHSCEGTKGRPAPGATGREQDGGVAGVKQGGEGPRSCLQFGEVNGGACCRVDGAHGQGTRTQPVGTQLCSRSPGPTRQLLTQGAFPKGTTVLHLGLCLILIRLGSWVALTGKHPPNKLVTSSRHLGTSAGSASAWKCRGLLPLHRLIGGVVCGERGWHGSGSGSLEQTSRQ